MSKGKIAIAMSGGVDSSAAAVILKKAGFDLVGFSMQLWDQRRSGGEADRAYPGRCCAIDDLYDAREVAARLKIPYYVVDFQREFERIVVKSFIDSYLSGSTPSPCVLCNSHMKFDCLAKMAEEVNASIVATGHYARISYDAGSGRSLLLQAVDKNKDQSYFLFELSQAQLAKAAFPLGDILKEQARQIARDANLPVAEKSESQEICFVPDGDYASFIERHSAADNLGGSIVDVHGKILGTHRGVHRYTIGQRRGLGIANPAPLYVIELRPEDKVVVVGERELLEKNKCRITRLNWISFLQLTVPIRVHAKIRSRHPGAAATVSPLPDGDAEVVFDEPQPAITPGQACVVYQSEIVAGGGWIIKTG